MSDLKINSLNPCDLGVLLPARKQRSNKSDYGRVLAVCGSRGMSGAAYFAAKAAYRTGCGIVEVLTPEENRTVLQTLVPEAIITCYDPENIQTNTVRNALKRADSAVIGCGLGTEKYALKMLCAVLDMINVPAVIDADGLNIISSDSSLWNKIKVPVIITPHPAEMSRLCGKSVRNILSDTVSTASKFATEHNVTCLIKDHKTVISDGKSVYINRFGNSGMSTGGSGDVLAGIIASLLSQSKNTNFNPCILAATGALIHSLAGERASEKLSEYSVIASDIIDCISEVMLETVKN